VRKEEKGEESFLNGKEERGKVRGKVQWSNVRKKGDNIGRKYPLA
jgi:hypothetical protein